MKIKNLNLANFPTKMQEKKIEINELRLKI